MWAMVSLQWVALAPSQPCWGPGGTGGTGSTASLGAGARAGAAHAPWHAVAEGEAPAAPRSSRLLLSPVAAEVPSAGS